MSKINIDRIVSDIRTRTTYITPLVEAVCNSMDAIGSKPDGKIDIIIKRAEILPEMGANALGDIIGIDVVDNGIGFTDENRESFDTFRSDMKVKQGGKGFGRFMYLKYFYSVSIESLYDDNGTLRFRNFTFGRGNDIIENEKVGFADRAAKTGTTVHLADVKSGAIQDKGLEVIARKLLERILVFFVDPKHPAPIIRIAEEDNSDAIILNDYIGHDKDIVFIGSSPIEIVDNESGEVLDFSVQMYKIYYSQAVSRVSLTANKREVTDTSIHTYVPEFQETLFEIDENGRQRNYSVKAYVLGAFLDDKNAVFNLLFLINIAMLINNKKGVKSEDVSKSTGKGMETPIGRFPFHVFHSLNWNVEHISPQNPKRKEDLYNQLYQLRTEYNGNLPKEVSALFKKLDDNKSNFDSLNNDAEYLLLIQKLIPEGEQVMVLQNLTLLTEHDNKGIGNKFYFDKRNKLNEYQSQGSFIPAATLNVFSKWYTKNPEGYILWGDNDQCDYLEAIKETIEKFINYCEGHE